VPAEHVVAIAVPPGHFSPGLQFRQYAAALNEYVAALQPKQPAVLVERQMLL
jgi:hypothetical protein